MTTHIVSAMFGGFDEIRRQADQDIDVDWVMFTDQPGPVPPPWRVVRYPPTDDDPRMAAKRYKCCPPFDGDVIWIDASMEVISHQFAREALAARNDGVAVFDHPRRNCIYDEAAAARGLEADGGKYDAFDLVAQVDAYRDEYPVDGGLYACGVVAWDMNDDRVRQLGRDWLAECERWSPQDQISFPVVARRLGIAPGVFPVAQSMQNRWLWIHQHHR